MVADVTIVGAGVIALTSAIAAADRGLRVRLVGTAHAGEASSASAGMLTPSVEQELYDVFDIAIESRDSYPRYLDMLEERTGIRVPLNRLGVLRLALDDGEADELQTTATKSGTTRWLDRSQLIELEPSYQHAIGAAYDPNNGCVDPIVLLEALRLVAATHPNISVANENVCSVEVSDAQVTVITDQDTRFHAADVVLAAGAWTPTIARPDRSIQVGETDSTVRTARQLPVEPVRGQIISYNGVPVRHVTYGAGGYLVPKFNGHTMVGSTFERAGFNTHTTPEGLAAVKNIARQLTPALSDACINNVWAGLRPVTPDMLPIIGRDPDEPRIVFACGHSRNGILLAPFTGEAVADLVTKIVPRYDLSRFRLERF